MHQPVHRCDGHRPSGEDLIPGRERLVGGDQQRTAFVAVADQFKQHAALLLIPPHIADVIDQQQRIVIQPFQRLWQVVVGAGLLQLLHQGCGWVKAAGLIQSDLRQDDADGQIGLAHTAGAEPEHVLTPLQSVALATQSLKLLAWARLDSAVGVVSASVLL